jgi:hypothetical protein
VAQIDAEHATGPEIIAFLNWFGESIRLLPTER